MSMALLSHVACLDHVTPDGHPERVDRMRAVTAALEAERFQDLIRIEAPAVSDEAVARAHGDGWLDALAARAPTSGFVALDADTMMSPGTLEAAKRAAGAVVEAIDVVLGGEANVAFCAVRPPGHHAERDRAMGFCFLSNVAIGALHAIEARGLSRVAIVDFDVHHGNGTQDVVERDPRIFYASTHQSPLYPGTGRESETGVGNVVNVELSALTDSAAFRSAFEHRVLPPLRRFKPELLIISAGFDAHRDDPLAQMELVDADFVWATRQLADVARDHSRGRIVSTLEGGYDLDALSRCVVGHVAALQERSVGRD